jgi:cytochrome c5
MPIPLKTISLLLACAAAAVACSKPQPEMPPSIPATASAAVAPLGGVSPIVPAVAPPVAPEHAEGKRVFDQTCGLCHGAGVGGAPRPGDKGNWGPRIAQGNDLLYRHALEGFSGATSFMPARGGASLTDAQVKAGVDYMVSLSR